MQSAAGNSFARRGKGCDTGEALLNSLANEDCPDKEEVEDDIGESASDRPDAKDTDDYDMWTMKPLARDRLFASYLQMPHMQWVLATEKLSSHFREEPLFQLQTSGSNM
eukprot:5440156-Karenia_brevis.AAC.1